MSERSKEFENALVEFKQQWPQVFLLDITPDDFVGMYPELPDNWDAPVYREIREALVVNYDKENGTGMQEIRDIVEGVLCAEPEGAEP